MTVIARILEFSETTLSRAPLIPLSDDSFPVDPHRLPRILQKIVKIFEQTILTKF